MSNFTDAVLRLTFLDVPDRPALRFVPFNAQGAHQRGMKIEPSLVSRALWASLARQGKHQDPPRYSVTFEYEPSSSIGDSAPGTPAEKLRTASRIASPHPAIGEMVRRLIAGFDPEQVILFGSYAKGTAGPDSDADLLVVMAFDGKRRAKTVELYGAVGAVGLAKDILLVTPDELRQAEPGSIADNALREGIVLYDRARIRA